MSRLKQNSNPRVIDGVVRTGNMPVGRKLKAYLQTHDRTKPVDIEAEFYYYVPPQKHKGGTFKFLRCRVVGLFNNQSKIFHLYVTNIPKTTLDAQEVARLYGARWLVELLFRELKKNYRMGEILSRKRHVVEALVYVALIGLLISRRFLTEIRRATKSQDKLPEERWAAIWETIASDLLAIALRPYRDRHAEKYLLTMIRREAIDPNKSRKLLPERAFT